MFCRLSEIKFSWINVDIKSVDKPLNFSLYKMCTFKFCSSPLLTQSRDTGIPQIIKNQLMYSMYNSYVLLSWCDIIYCSYKNVYICLLIRSNKISVITGKNVYLWWKFTFLKQLVFLKMNTISLSWWNDIFRKDEEEKSILLWCNQ